MAKTIEQIMADMAAQGITINVKLAPGTRDGNSPSELIRDAAEVAGIAYRQTEETS